MFQIIAFRNYGKLVQTNLTWEEANAKSKQLQQNGFTVSITRV